MSKPEDMLPELGGYSGFERRRARTRIIDRRREQFPFDRDDRRKNTDPDGI